MVHKNSRESYDKCKRDKSFRRIIHRIARFFEDSGCRHTDREVRDQMWKDDELPYFDMNCVRPKINKLIEGDMLEECGKKYDTKTLRTVRQVQWRLK